MDNELFQHYLVTSSGFPSRGILDILGVAIVQKCPIVAGRLIFMIPYY